jgi:tellurite resistance protein TerC
MEYLAGYLLEKSLAIDNVFVWLMIFAAFAIPPSLQRKILLYGVLGAIVLRTIFIFIGAWFVQEFSWILYIFGAFLVYTGFKFLKGQGDEQPNIEDMALLKWLRKHMRITPSFKGDRFFVKEQGILWATPLFIVLILVEFSDVIRGRLYSCHFCGHHRSVYCPYCQPDGDFGLTCHVLFIGRNSIKNALSALWFRHYLAIYRL